MLVQPSTTFRRKPMTLHGKTEAVIQDAEHLLDIAARADVLEAIRQNLDDVASGRTRSGAQSIRRDSPEASNTLLS